MTRPWLNQGRKINAASIVLAWNLQIPEKTFAIVLVFCKWSNYCLMFDGQYLIFSCDDMACRYGHRRLLWRKGHASFDEVNRVYIHQLVFVSIGRPRGELMCYGYSSKALSISTRDWHGLTEEIILMPYSLFKVCMITSIMRHFGSYLYLT